MRLALLLTASMMLPAHNQPARLIYQGKTSGKEVALTFDAGADRGFAPQILRILERRHLHATFGMTGLWARRDPALVRRMARDGDVIINHTYDHRSFTGLSTHTAALTYAQRAWEVNQAEAAVRRITGRSTKPFFRPPFGDYDAETLALARRLGYRYVVMWTLDSLGWEHLPAPAILQRCLDLVKPGAIILMHVGSQSQDAIALPALISSLERRGYRLVTVSQLLLSAPR